MTVLSRSFLVASCAAVVLSACGSGDDGIDRVASSPATLPELDGVVLTVAPADLAGEPIVVGDSVPDDADVVPISEIVDDDTASSDGDEGDGADGGDRDDDADDGLNPLGGDDPEDKLMPDVVCMDLQDAQNEVQDRGVFFSRSEDATGEGRRQLWDRNWVVVAQHPPAGSPIGEGDAVLSVVKDDEPNDC